MKAWLFGHRAKSSMLPRGAALGVRSMGRLLGFCLILASTTAFAAGFPVAAAYGTASACAAFLEGGVHAVVTGDDLSAILVTPIEVAAAGLTCSADKAQVDGVKVVAACTVAPDQPFTLTATIEENASAGIVKYSAGEVTVTLKRCN